MSDCPTAADLMSMGATIGDMCLINAELSRWFRGAHTSAVRTSSQPDPLPEGQRSTRKHAKGNGRRSYKSIYVGVTTHNKRYVGQWGPHSAHKGRVRPLTPDGARWAAEERARALGLNYLEKRDGTREPYRHDAPEDP